MLQYDAETFSPNQEWLALDEMERMIVVMEYHKRLKINMPNARLHAIAHVVVENQLDEGLEPVKEKLAELIRDGLSRHDAIHAIGTVVMAQTYDMLKNGKTDDQPVLAYYDRLKKLTAKSWRMLGE